MHASEDLDQVLTGCTGLTQPGVVSNEELHYRAAVMAPLRSGGYDHGLHTIRCWSQLADCVCARLVGSF